MKCINKWGAVCLTALLSFNTAGCGEKPAAMAYDPDSEVSGFRVVTQDASQIADAFASGLCVVDGDINVDDTIVDMADATSAGLFDLNSHQVLYAKNIHERLAPASLTKLMTAVVALKYGNPDDVITATSNVNITESGAVLCGLKEGDRLTLNQALHALLMKSANDAAVAIAEHIGGSVEAFAEMMNEEARSLGLKNTHFTNPHGLHDPDHFTSARDLGLIACRAMSDPVFKKIVSTKRFDVPASDHTAQRVWYNKNKMLTSFEGANGIKTGYTTMSGRCLVAAAEREDYEQALYYKQKLEVLDKLVRRQVTALPKDLNIDVFAVASSGLNTVAAVLFVRGGKLLGGDKKKRFALSVDSNIFFVLQPLEIAL